MPVDLGVFERQKTIVDQQQLQDAFELKKALALQQLAGQARGDDLPAPLQLANEYQKRISAGDMQGANLIMQFAKTQDKGLQVTGDGTFAQLPGYAPAVAGIEGAKAGAKQTAQNISDVTYKPQITAGDEFAKKNSDLQAKLPVDQGLLGTALQSIQQQQDRIKNLGIIQNPDGTFVVPSGLAGNFGTRSYLPNIRGGEAANAETDLSQINANSFIQALGAMKAQSATGASGLGALSEKEGDKVQAAAAALGKSQDAQSFAKNLKIYNDALEQSKGTLQKNFDLVHPGARPNEAPGKLIGTSGGKNVYELPDGSHVMEQ